LGLFVYNNYKYLKDIDMKNWMIILIAGGGLLLLGLFGFLYANSVYNKAITLQETVDAEWGNVQTTYQRRADLIPNLVNIVKGAAENEKEILTQVTQARAGIVNAKTPQDMELMGKKINTAINLAFEAYPEIRSTQNFSDLQAQLEGTESRITVARKRYNESVKPYNIFIRGIIRGKMLDLLNKSDEFEKKEMFEAAAGSDVAPTVEF
jgi:LemA protein